MHRSWKPARVIPPRVRISEGPPLFKQSHADVVKLVYTPDLGSGAARRGGSSPLIRTILNNSQTPYSSDFQATRETFEKLNQIEKQLKLLDLYNSKYLLKRNSIYYFVLRVSKTSIIKKSLHTTNYTHAIILKLKIMNRLSKMGLGDKGFPNSNSKCNT